MDTLDALRYRAVGVDAIEGRIDQLVAPKQQARETLGRLRWLRPTLSRLDAPVATTEDAEAVTQLLSAAPSGSDAILAIWGDGGVSLWIPHAIFGEALRELWRPGETIWFTDRAERWLGEVTAEGSVAISAAPREEPAQGRMRIMYVEKKSGQNDRGPAWIGNVRFSKSGRTLRYRGKEFRSLKGSGIGANYHEVATGEQYWISGCKASGGDRHPAGGGPVHIDSDVRREYWITIRNLPARVDEATT